MPHVEIYTDGACSGNPGPGGYAAIIYIDKQPPIKITGYKPNTTSNRMELTAVIEALNQIERPSKVKVFSDSKYVIDSMNGKWEKKTNFDLWRKLEMNRLLAHHSVEWIWIPGNSDQIDHRECDSLAKAAATGQMQDALTMIRPENNKTKDSEPENALIQAKADLCIEEIESVLIKWGFASKNKTVTKDEHFIDTIREIFKQAEILKE